MLSRSQLRARREDLTRVWDQVVGSARLRQAEPDASVRPVVLDSWRRSAVVDPRTSAAPVDADEDAVRRWQRSAVGRTVARHAEHVHAVVEDADLVAAVTDPYGRIVWTAGGRVMRRRAEAVAFVPGSHWDERSVGTNALGLSLHLRRPATVYSAEHFIAGVHGWVCYAVPLLRPDGRLLGVLDLSTTWDRAHPLVLTAAQGLADRVVTDLPDDADLDGAAPGVSARLLGHVGLLRDGATVPLPGRQAEVLALLLLHRDGLTAAELRDRVWGPAGPSASTPKAEVSHLRDRLGGKHTIGSRPYRLDVAVDADVVRLRAALDAGRVAEAVALHRGPLLPASEAPAVREWRDFLEVAVRAEVLRCDDVDVVRTWADAQPYDAAVAEHLARLLPADDPRSGAVAARRRRAAVSTG